MTKRTFLGIVVLLVALAGALAAQQQQPAPAAPAPAQQPGAQLPDLTFRAEVNYVEVDARVLDENGKFIGGLTAKDFQVFEDGKPQQVSIFSFVNLPVERAERPLFASKPIEPDVNTNLAGQNGRVYLIVLDDLHTNALRTHAGQGRGAAVHRALRRRQRPRRCTPHQRADERQPGVHEQPAPDAQCRGQVHGPQAPLVDAEHASTTRR